MFVCLIDFGVFTRMVICALKFNKVNLRSSKEKGGMPTREYLDIGCLSGRKQV